MLIRRLQQAVQKFVEDLDNYLTLIIAAALAIWNIIGPPGSTIMQSGTLAVLTLLAFNILRNRTNLEHVTKNLPPSIKIYQQQEDAYKFLEECIQHRHVRDAVLIQYSCNSAMTILSAILSRGATATVYIEDEKISTAIGAHEQTDRITHWQKSHYTVLTNLPRPNCLKLYKYQVPGSVSGIRINLGTKQLLCMGWYTYEHADGTNRNPFYPSDTVQISGHDVAAVVVWSGTEHFDALNKTFSMLEKNYEMNSQEVAL